MMAVEEVLFALSVIKKAKYSISMNIFFIFKEMGPMAKLLLIVLTHINHNIALGIENAGEARESHHYTEN